jgi:hypothetical protein
MEPRRDFMWELYYITLNKITLCQTAISSGKADNRPAQATTW